MPNLFSLGLLYLISPVYLLTLKNILRFSREDMYAQDSIELLTNSGIQFKKHETDGIDPFLFSELFITSGFVLEDNVKWLSFHR